MLSSLSKLSSIFKVNRTRGRGILTINTTLMQKHLLNQFKITRTNPHNNNLLMTLKILNTSPPHTSSSSSSSSSFNRNRIKRKSKFNLIAKMLNLTSTVANLLNSRKQNKLPKISDPLLLQPAHKLSKQIKDGSLTSVKLCEAYIERIKQVQPIINAMTQDRFKEALEEAKRIDSLLASFRSDSSKTLENNNSYNNSNDNSSLNEEELELLNSPLLGIPISVKESIMINGMRNTCGLWHRRDTKATEDAIVIKNIKRFGMIPLCCTNVPEGTLYWADCHNTVYGRSLNPYDLNRVTGASSGGEGSLIGSGSSLMGIGSDIGGSLRIPAHYCGINSHKPSPFLLSSEGNYPKIIEHRLRIFTLGPMTRYASDLRPFLKCLMMDKDNSKQDTYFKYQPTNICQLREELIEKLSNLDDNNVINELYLNNNLKIYYFNFNEQSLLKGKSNIKVSKEFLLSQNEILNHFKTKFNCQLEHLNLDKYFKRSMIIWQSLLVGAGTIDRDLEYNKNELKEAFGIKNVYLEFLKFGLGLSNHTKESILSLTIGKIIPNNRDKAFEICDKFEKLCIELKNEFHLKLGDNGVLIMPTLPSLAYEHHFSLTKTNDLRFPSIFNYLQVPVTHVTFGKLDKKFKLPYGFSIVAKPYNDALTISIAEEIECAFGGWQEPSGLISGLSTSESSSSTSNANDEYGNNRAASGGSDQRANAAPTANVNADSTVKSSNVNQQATTIIQSITAS